MAMGPEKSWPIKLEADTGANVTVMTAGILEDMDWVDMEETNMKIKGYSGIAEECVGKARISLRRGTRTHKEEVFFSNATTSNFLSRDACMAFGIIPKGFPEAEVNGVKATGVNSLRKIPDMKIWENSPENTGPGRKI